MANLNILNFNQDLKLNVKAKISTWHQNATYKNLVTFFFGLIIKHPERFKKDFIEWIEERKQTAA